MTRCTMTKSVRFKTNAVGTQDTIGCSPTTVPSGIRGFAVLDVVKVK